MDRRTLLRAGAAGAVVPGLASCGGPTDSDDAVPTARNTEDPATTPLAETADIAVGGAVFVDAVDVPGEAVSQGVVITQPTAGEFRAFSRDCSHMHCAVSDLRDGQIHCFCHNSLYDLTTGDNVGGPAPSPLKAVPIEVRDGGIFRA